MKSSSYNHKRSVTVGRKCIQYVQLYNTLIYHVLHFAAFLAFSNPSKRRRCNILTNSLLFDRAITILKHLFCAKILTGNLARRVKKRTGCKRHRDYLK